MAKKLEIRLVQKGQFSKKVKIAKAGFGTSIVAGLVAAGIFCSAFYTFAYFTPGQEPNPSCSPTDPTCTVTPPLSSGSDASLNSLTLNTVLGAGYGGTGKSSWTANGVLYASDSTTLSQTSTGNAGQYLVSGGPSSAPEWTTLSAVPYTGATAPVDLGVNNLTTSGALKATNSDGSKWVTLTDDGTSANLTTDHGGDVYFFDNTTAPNYYLRINGHMPISGVQSGVKLGFDNTYDDFLISVDDGNSSTTLNAAVRLDDTVGHSHFLVEKPITGDPVFDVASNGNTTITGGLVVSGLLQANGGIDPPYMSFTPQTQKSLKTAIDNLPDNKLLGAVMFYNQAAGDMEIYMPWNDTFYSLGGTQIASDGTVGSGSVSGIPSGADFNNMLTASLASLGVAVSDGTNGLKNLIVDTITTKNVKMETMEMVDKSTGSVYCVFIDNGEWQKTEGPCGNSTTPAAQIGLGASPESATDDTEDAQQAAQQQAIAAAAAQAAQQAAQQAAAQTANQIQQQVKAQSLDIAAVAALSDINVPYGTTLGALNLPANANVMLEDKSTQNLGITWDHGTPAYNGSAPATYTFSGTPNLQTGITNTGKLIASVKVTVGQAPDPSSTSTPDSDSTQNTEQQPQTPSTAPSSAGAVLQDAASALTVPIYGIMDSIGNFLSSTINGVSSSNIFQQAKAELINPINIIWQTVSTIFSK